jgi:hypothetical protein
MAEQQAQEPQLNLYSFCLEEAESFPSDKAAVRPQKSHPTTPR